MKKNEKFLVEFVNEKEFYVPRDQSILQASLAAGIPHFHACGGNAKCSTCKVLILEREESLNQPNQKEKLPLSFITTTAYGFLSHHQGKRDIKGIESFFNG
jgi:ferredoxin